MTRNRRLKLWYKNNVTVHDAGELSHSGNFNRTFFGIWVGAVGALIVQRTFKHGFQAVLLTGLGSSAKIIRKGHKMKKIVILVSIMSFIICMTACGNDAGTKEATLSSDTMESENTVQSAVYSETDGLLGDLSETEPELQTETKQEETEPKPQTETELPEIEPKQQTETEPELRTKTELKQQTETEPKQQTETEPKLQTEIESELQMEIEQEETEMMLNIQIGEHLLTATLAQNSSADALVEMLSEGPVTIHMNDYANMEKVGTLPKRLPKNDEQISTNAGDLILYQGNSFVIYYDTNSWNFTRLGKVNDVTQQELKDIMGEGSVTVILSLPVST